MAYTPNQQMPSASPDLSGHTPVAPAEIATGVVIGRASEYFDFFVYGIASVLVFPSVFFPFAGKLQGLLYSFTLFAFAFIGRPFGTALFIKVQRRWGRGIKLTAALFLLGTATCGIVFLPGYASLGGTSIVLLTIFRILQGIALGGSWDGLPSLLALNTPAQRRGRYAMVGQLGAPTGFLVAASLFLFLHSSLEQAEFLEWGWRYPFYVAFAINVVALFARLRLVVTHEYTQLLEEGELEPISTVEIVKAPGYNLFLGAFAALASYALFHLVTAFPLSWVALQTPEKIDRVLTIQIFGAVLAMLGTLASGVIADRIGRRTTLGLMAVLIGVFALLSPWLLGGWQLRQGSLHPDWLLFAGPVVWAGGWHCHVKFRAALPLYWGSADNRLCVADRRSLRALGGAWVVGGVRLDICQWLSPFRRGLHPIGAEGQPHDRESGLT